MGRVARRRVRRARRSRRSTAGRAAASSPTRSRVEEVARVCASSSLFTFISKLGDDAACSTTAPTSSSRSTSPRVASGECQASYCLSEADAGQRRRRACAPGPCATATTTCSTGRKMWITNAGVSDFYTVFAKTDPDAGHRGISCFVVEKDVPGLLGRRSSSTRSACAAHRRARSSLDDCVGAGREPHRRGGPRLLLRDGRARPFASARRRAGARHRAGRARARDELRAGAQAVRPRHRRLPGPAVHARRHGDRRSTRRALLVYRACSLLDDGLPGTGERVVDGEAVRVRHRDAGDDRLRAAARRRRLHEGLAGRALHARRQDHPDLRGHEPDPAGRDRQAPARR